MSQSSSFDLLSNGVQRWIYRQGWPALRSVQEKAIPVILDGSEDILITAPTAGGKTEAAFLPIISWLEENGPEYGFGVLCLSPLKALINDQFKRLELLCESAHTTITPWHGDVSSSVKKRSWNEATGILMITPESLEAMFVRRAHELLPRMRKLRYVVIDEYHAFIGRERGQQLLSLLARLEVLIERPLIRIALSATIGNTDMALKYLRSDSSRPSMHLDASGEKTKLQMVLKAFTTDKEDMPALFSMAQYLFQELRGESHLVFANSRRKVEETTDFLISMCNAEGVPEEFFPHHGSLSRDMRHFVEERLKAGKKPTTAIATSTLELGIDIGDVVSVGQIGAPANCSSLRQRLGRSGRREGSSSILRVLVEGYSEGDAPSITDKLELELFQAVAVLELMLSRWIEPPNEQSIHFSTLIQQLLSIISFKGDITAQDAYQILCVCGPWQHISPELFGRFLRSLGSNNVISQLPTKELVVGLIGEREVSKHTFYTAFEVPEEFSLVANGKTIGKLPVDSPLVENQLLLFGGRRWSVIAVDVEAKVITLKRAGGGKAPSFGGEPAPIHIKIREKMRELYLCDKIPTYCDEKASKLLTNARTFFREQGLENTPVTCDSDEIVWLIWADTRIQNTLLVIASLAGYEADKWGPTVRFKKTESIEGTIMGLYEFLAHHSAQEITSKVNPIPIGKFDHLLDEQLLREAYVAETMDIAGISLYLEQILEVSDRIYRGQYSSQPIS